MADKRKRISKRFEIGGLSPDAPWWNTYRGFTEGCDMLCLAYSVGREEWAIGLAFHSAKDAEIALKVVERLGITPAIYHAMEDTEAIKREIVSNLQW